MPGPGSPRGRPGRRFARAPSRTGPSGRRASSRGLPRSRPPAHERHLQPVDLVAEQEPAPPAVASSRSAPWSSTPSALPMPSLVTKSRPKKARPLTEIATVTPAKITARPAEAPASAAASGGEAHRAGAALEAGDDEQRVVDADPEADHRDQDRRDRVDVGQAGQEEQEQERRPQSRERQPDRNDHPDEGAEHEEQHDDRRQQAEHLRGALLHGRELRLAVELCRHTGRLDRLANRVLDGNDRVPVTALDGLIELRLRVRDPDRRRRTCPR